MDGDTIIMNPTDGRHVKIVEEHLLQQEQQIVSHPNLPQDESRDSRYTSFHRRSRLRSELDITPTGCSIAADSSAVGDVLVPDNEHRGITGCLASFAGSFLYCLFQIVLAIVEVVFSAACNPRLWNVAWIAVSAAAEIFIYLVLALATVFVAIIINIYEGSRRDVTFEGEGQSDRETMPKESVVMPNLPSDIDSKPSRVQKKD